MHIRCLTDDEPFIMTTDGRLKPEKCLLETFDEKLLRHSFLRHSATFIPREMFLLLKKQYAQDSQFGSNNHSKLLSQIVLILQEVIY